MILHVHKQRTDELNLRARLNEFVSGNEHRSNTNSIDSQCHNYFLLTYVPSLYYHM